MLIFESTLVVLMFTFAVSQSDFQNPLSDEYIELINSKQKLWTAGRNYPEDTPLELLLGLSGTILIDIPDDGTIITHEDELIASLPESFDARDKWPNCPSINEIRDQGWCGSCWAHGAVEAMTDRWCIHSNGTQQFHFSAQDVAECAAYNGCHGSSTINAWEFWNTNGIVSGGNYNTNEYCKPYVVAPCHTKYCPPLPKLVCIDECQYNSEISYQGDKRFGQKPYFINGEEHIMAELYLNGPLEVSFQSCPDIHDYTVGVYNSTCSHKRTKGHAVKVIGWGVENGTKYWLLSNSWGYGWGKLGGYFKILRGVNHMNIETGAVAGMPDYEL